MLLIGCRVLTPVGRGALALTHLDVYNSTSVYTPPGVRIMRTNIVIDPKLMGEALRLSGAPTKRQVVEDSLRLLIRIKKQERIRKVRGKLKWTGDLESMRLD
jgi:Arc/MetJ family transcription regulator